MRELIARELVGHRARTLSRLAESIASETPLIKIGNDIRAGDLSLALMKISVGGRQLLADLPHYEANWVIMRAMYLF